MSQQQIYKSKQHPVRRIDEALREWETTQYEETLQRARRASRKARQTTARAQALLKELEEF